MVSVQCYAEELDCTMISRRSIVCVEWAEQLKCHVGNLQKGSCVASLNQQRSFDVTQGQDRCYFYFITDGDSAVPLCVTERQQGDLDVGYENGVVDPTSMIQATTVQW